MSQLCSPGYDRNLHQEAVRRRSASGEPSLVCNKFHVTSCPGLPQLKLPRNRYWFVRLGPTVMQLVHSMSLMCVRGDEYRICFGWYW